MRNTLREFPKLSRPLHSVSVVAKQAPLALSNAKVSCKHGLWLVARVNKNPGDIISGAYDVRDRIRTHDLLVRSQTLYPAELHVHFIYRFSPATVCIVTAAGENVNRIFQFFQTILSAACFSVACTTFTSYFSRMSCLNSS